MHIRHVLPQPAMGMVPDDPPNAALTGVVNAAWNIALKQAAAGHTVEMIAPGDQRHQSTRRIGGVQLTWLPQWRWLSTARYDFSNLLPLLLVTLRSQPVDVTHVHGNPYFLVGARSRTHVLHLQNSPVAGSPRYDQAAGRADQVICCSHFIRQQFVDAVAYPPQRVHVVHNGVNWAEYAHGDRTAARAAYQLAEGQTVALYVGRIGAEKGLLVLIKAYQQLAARGVPPPLLLVAGSGKLGFEGHPAAWQELQGYEQEVRQQAQGLPVRFLGDVPRPLLPSLYRAADLFVCPSVYAEPFGMVNVEAAAAGLPVIASAVGGIPEAVLHEQNGLLVQPNDPAHLAEALGRLLSDHALCRRLGQTAQQTARRFDWQELAQTITALYAPAAHHPGAQRPLSA